MTTKDLFITPIFLGIILGLAYFFRGTFTDEKTRRYFIPALAVRLFGALAVGLIYQFYYGGGDTFNYHTHGSLHIWRALIENPSLGIQLLLAKGGDYYEAFQYSSGIWYYRDPAGYLIVKIAALFDFFTYGTYSATACFFALISFIGGWALFQTFYQKYPGIHFQLALSTLFIPSVFFWGSGIFKDTITLAMMSLLIYASNKVFIQGKYRVFNSILLLLSAIIIYKLKIYVLLVALPCIILWIFLERFRRISRIELRILAFPIVVISILVLGYFAIIEVGQDNPRYSLDRIAETARITAYDIRYGWGARDGTGSGYDIGVPDGTFAGLLSIAPEAINVSLFRPYLFEVNNPLMLFASIESAIVSLLTLYVLYIFFRNRTSFKEVMVPDVTFCLVFALVFAFAVGASTFNFGTLSRYKLPMLPLYFTGLSLIFARIKGYIT